MNSLKYLTEPRSKFLLLFLQQENVRGAAIFRSTKVTSFNFQKHYDLRKVVSEALACFRSCHSKIAISFALSLKCFHRNVRFSGWNLSSHTTKKKLRVLWGFHGWGLVLFHGKKIQVLSSERQHPSRKSDRFT